VELLVSQGADITTANREGQTAVELAATTFVRQLLLAAVDKGGPQHNLCQAAWQGNAAVLRRTLVRQLYFVLFFITLLGMSLLMIILVYFSVKPIIGK